MTYDSPLRIALWKKEKKEFEINKTIQLKKDEIHRLKKEYSLILTRLSQAHDHFHQSKSIYISKIKSLQSQIESIPTAKSIKITKLNSQHTKSMNELKNRHSSRLQNIRMKYEKELFRDDLGNEDDNVISSLDSTRSKIADLLGLENEEKQPESMRVNHIQNERHDHINNMNEIEKENAIQEKLMKIKEQVDDDRKRIKYLEEKIDVMKSDLEEAREISNSQRTEIIMKSPLKFDEHQKQHKLLMKEANIVSEENRYKDSSENQIESLRAGIHATQIRIDHLKHNIKHAQANVPSDLENALEELKDLEEDNSAIIQQHKTMNDIKLSISKHKRKRKRMEKSMTFAITSLNEAQKENLALLEEIRRLDYMIYGRNGQYQKKTRSPTSLRNTV